MYSFKAKVHYAKSYKLLQIVVELFLKDPLHNHKVGILIRYQHSSFQTHLGTLCIIFELYCMLYSNKK